MYGGRNNFEKDLDDVWVLTLPGFHWQRVEIDSPRRYFQSCVSIGQRQILSIGGDSDVGWSTDDPWTNGIAIFDLYTLSWATGYDADADDYEPAEAVQDWYKQGYVRPRCWTC